MSTNKYKFQNLTPIDDADISIYEDALTYVFSNNDIKNVAISGSYSAGKSSIIETYKKSHEDTKFIHISLAHFDSFDEGNIEFDEQKGNSLEGKILNQLIHQIEPDKIPQTKFNIKKDLSKKDTHKTIAYFVVLLVSILLIFNFSNWKEYVNSLSVPFVKSILSLTTPPEFLIPVAIISLVLLIVISYKIIKIQYNKNLLKKVAFQGNEIELFEQENDSYFDKYLNEIIYLFENCGANVIVFEDMDRFNSNEIFQRLREVNILVNNKRNDNSPIRFFYLLKDDIFSSKDRTKFFDFILPIIPIVDSSNAYDKFIEHFKDGGIFELFNEEFLQGISLYIDDMRILKNIYNEFIIYKERIGTTGQDANKLLAIIVYKNLFPRDFAQLQLNKGFVYELFTSKEQFIKDEQSKLEDLISAKTSRIEAIEKEVLNSTQEIDYIYDQFKYREYYSNRLKKEYQDERDARVENLNLAQSGGIEQIKKEISEHEKAILKLQSSKLSEIITRDNIDEIFKITKTNEIGEEIDFNDVKVDDYFDLLKYLIRYGYIDESYPDYMTYFYEHSLSRNDKIFLRSVTDQKAKPHDYTINNPALVVSRLRDVDFENKETLNNDVLEYILSKHPDCEEKLLVLLEQLKKSKAFDFIKQFIEISSVTPKFIEQLCKHWTSFFLELLKGTQYSKDDIRKIAVLILCFSLPESLPSLDEKDEFSWFIENDSDFLKFESPNLDKMIDSLKLLNIKFDNLNLSDSNTDIWNAVYSNNLYRLNWNMLNNILVYEYKIEETDAISHKCLTLILSNEKANLCAYIKTEINESLRVIIENCDGEITDEEDISIWVLNNTDVAIENKQQYIEVLSTKIIHIDSITNGQLWTPLLDEGVVVCSAENILDYFINAGKKYDDSLINFINDNSDDFQFDEQHISQLDEEVVKEFLDETVKCNQLETNCYELIIGSLKYHYISFSFENIDKEKLNVLLLGRKIKMNSKNLEFMRETYPDSVITFIESQATEYIEDAVDEDTFNFEELIKVLNADVDISIKLRLLNYTTKPISIARESYQEEIVLHILKNNFQSSDLKYIIYEYGSFSNDIKIAIVAITEENIDKVISEKISLPYSLLIEILRRTTIDEMVRFEVFSYSLSSLDFNECNRCLTILQADEYLSLFEGKRPKIFANATSDRILEVFKKNSWISKYEFDEDHENYRVIGKKTRNGYRYI